MCSSDDELKTVVKFMNRLNVASERARYLEIVRLCTQPNDSALHWAAKNQHCSVAELLLEHGADLSTLKENEKKQLANMINMVTVFNTQFEAHFEKHLVMAMIVSYLL